MLSPTRVKIGISLLALFTLAGSLLFFGLLSHGHATHAASPQSSGATTGKLIPAAVVDPKRLTMTNTSTASFPKGARRYQSSTKSPAHVPQTATTSQMSSAGTLLQGFNGVSSRDGAVTNFVAEFEPPDQGLCVGNGFVVEPVNSAYTIYRDNGTVVAGPFNVNKLFDEGFKQFTSDPRCYYDKTTHTWFAIILFINSTSTGARTDIAVNNSGDPTT